MSFRFTEVLLLACAGLWLVHAVQLARLPLRRSWPSFLIVVFGVTVSLLGYLLLPRWSGTVAVTTVVLLLIMPAVLTRQASHALRWGRVRLARTLALLAFVVRPIAPQRRFRRALETSWRLGQGQDVDFTAAIEALAPSGEVEAQARRVAFLSWVNDFRAMGDLLADPKVRGLAMRAGMTGIVATVVGETADDEAVLEQARRLLAAPAVHYRGIDATWALVATAAYLGDVDLVASRVAELAHEIPPDRRAFILASAQQRVGKAAAARDTVEAALAAGSPVPMGLERLRYRLTHPLSPVALMPGLAEARKGVAERLRVRAALSELGLGLSKPAPITMGIAVALCAIFGWQTTQTRVAVFGGLGLNAPFASAPDPWRLWTYACVHLNVAHLLFNVIGLLVFGRFVERHFGRARMLLVYGAGAAGGGLAYLLFETGKGVAIGASGAVFALFGATVVRIALDGELRRSQQGRRMLLFLATIAGSQLAVDASWAQSSGSAHAGGLLSGLVLASVMLALRRLGEARRVAA